MRKLSTEQRERKAKLVKDLDGTAKEIAEAIAELNETARDKLAPLIAKYNDLIGSATTFCEEVAQEMDDYMADRSETWKSSPSGEAYEQWHSEWTDLDFEWIVLDFEIEAPEPGDSETLEGLDDEPPAP